MLEFPESHYMAKQINEGLLGKEIDDVIILQSPHRFAFFWGEKEGYPTLLLGRSIQEAKARGGLLRIDTEDTMMIFSDGTAPHYCENSSQYPKKHQFFVHFTDGSAIYCSIQMYGIIGVMKLDDCQQDYYRAAVNKPDILADSFTYDYFNNIVDEACSEKKLSAKAFLATQQRFPGLGNGVLQDILWNAGIHPKCNMSQLESDDLKRMYESVRSTIREMTEMGGRDVERDLYGNPGGYKTVLSKNTLGSSCFRCGHEIEKCAYMGGVIYYCSNCQKLCR